MPKRVGVIGVGSMGRGMVQTLLKNGYKPTIYDISPGAVTAMVALGAVSAPSPKEVGKASDVVVTSLPNQAVVEATITGEAGLLEGMSPGCYVIDMSTIDPGTTRRLHEQAAARGVHTIDAPVSGGPQAASSGSLTIMVGGTKEDYEACLDILNVLGKTVVHVGPIGAGQTVKLCNNAAAAAQTVIMGEVLLTGVKAGVDLKVLVKAIGSASGNCWILQNFFPKTVLAGKYDPPLFSLDLMVKDLGLYMKTIQELGIPSVMASLAYQIYSAGQATGKGKEDHTGVVRVGEALAGAAIGVIEPSDG
jgi:3-hydroxyisobutyrate dehydrogenase-like beta-hydroxyacid dehydrogenase